LNAGDLWRCAGSAPRGCEQWEVDGRDYGRGGDGGWGVGDPANPFGDEIGGGRRGEGDGGAGAWDVCDELPVV